MSPSGADVRCEWRTTQERSVRSLMWNHRSIDILILCGFLKLTVATKKVEKVSQWMSFKQSQKERCGFLLAKSVNDIGTPSAPSKKTRSLCDFWSAEWRDLKRLRSQCSLFQDSPSWDSWRNFCKYQGFSAWHGIVSSNRIMVLHDSVLRLAITHSLTRAQDYWRSLSSMGGPSWGLDISLGSGHWSMSVAGALFGSISKYFNDFNLAETQVQSICFSNISILIAWV